MDRLNSMRVFQRVVDEGGFAAAARALDMSPAVVTRLVADLESHLRTRLLHRTTRRMSLTEAGEAYLVRVRQILLDLDEADAVVSQQTQQLSGVLRILAPPVMATHLLAPVIAGFLRAYPDIQLDVEVDSRSDLPIKEHDITLFGASDGFDGQVIARKIIDAEGILVASPQYLARRGAPVTPADLRQHDCLRVKVEGGRGRHWRLFRSDNEKEHAEVDVKPLLWANHTDTLLRATLDGVGITGITIGLAAPHLSSGALQRVLSPWITGRYSLYAGLPSRQFMPQRTRVFLEYLTEETRKNIERALAACMAC